MDCGGQGLPNGTFRALCPTGHRAHPRLRTAPGTDGRTGSRMTGKGGAPYGDHHQPDQSAVHPSPQAGVLRFLSPGLRGVPLRQPQVAGGGFAVESGPADSGLHGPRCPACPARCCPPRPGTRGFDEIHLSRTDAPGRPLRVRPAGPDASRTADRPPVRGPGRGSGSGECGDDPPDGGRLSRRRIVFGERLRGPIQSQDRSGLHGCGVPLPGVDLRAGRAAGAADEERPALVWRGPSERYGGRAAGGLLSLRRGRWQRGEGPLGGRAGGL